jgi:hypothetical protein
MTCPRKCQQAADKGSQLNNQCFLSLQQPETQSVLKHRAAILFLIISLSGPGRITVVVLQSFYPARVAGQT